MSTAHSLALALVLVGSMKMARGESGSPGVVTPFDDKDVVPTNALIPLPGANGVPVGLTQLKKLAPRLVGASSSIPLQIVDSFDDLEGHSTPFPEDGGGYGSNLILLAPHWRLARNTRYAFTVGKGADATAYFHVTTGTEPDTTAPKWRRAPFLDLDDLHAENPLMPSHIITAIDEPPELPLYLIVNLVPQDPQARPKRMIAALHLASTDDDNCGFVNVWDHAHGVYAEDTDRDLGKRYMAKLTAVDAAGNRRSAPPPGVPVVWSGGVAVCNQPDLQQTTETKPAPPRWLAKPTHQSTINSNFSPASDQGTPYEHTLKLPIETTTAAFVELSIRRRSAPFTSYRRVALLSPTIRVSPNPASPAPHEDNCVEALITNADREKPAPSNDEPVSVAIALIDALGRRLEHPGPPIVVTRLHPQRSRILVCPAP